jgi:hypothetical protein
MTISLYLFTREHAAHFINNNNNNNSIHGIVIKIKNNMIMEQKSFISIIGNTKV